MVAGETILMFVNVRHRVAGLLLRLTPFEQQIAPLGGRAVGQIPAQQAAVPAVTITAALGGRVK